MNTPKLTLISHALCPYVQRAAIALLEKGVPFERRTIDLSDKPDWFVKLSPLAKVPVLVVDDETVLFESSVIAEYVNELTGSDLLAADLLEKSRQRAWIEFASAGIANIGRLYSAHDEAAFESASVELVGKFETLEGNLGGGPYFDDADFSLVDAAFAPTFRYFDVIEQLTTVDFFRTTPKVSAWRAALDSRASVQNAVDGDYLNRLLQFFAEKPSVIGAAARLLLGDAQRAVA